VLQKRGEFNRRDEALIGVSERQLSHVCAELDERIVYSWHQLRTIELQQSVTTRRSHSQLSLLRFCCDTARCI